MINRSRIREREYFHAEGWGMSRILERRKNPEGRGGEEERKKRSVRSARRRPLFAARIKKKKKKKSRDSLPFPSRNRDTVYIRCNICILSLERFRAYRDAFSNSSRACPSSVTREKILPVCMFFFPQQIFGKF